jgi:hypothetical protein
VLQHLVNDRQTLKVPIVPGPRGRPVHADEEILQLCEDIRQFGNQDLTGSPTTMRCGSRLADERSRPSASLMSTGGSAVRCNTPETGTDISSWGEQLTERD